MNWKLIFKECGCKISVYDEFEHEPFYHSCSNLEHIKENNEKNLEIHRPKPPTLKWKKSCGCKQWTSQEWNGEVIHAFNCGRCKINPV